MINKIKSGIIFLDSATDGGFDLGSFNEDCGKNCTRAVVN